MRGRRTAVVLHGVGLLTVSPSAGIGSVVHDRGEVWSGRWIVRGCCRRPGFDVWQTRNC
ncbi:hypothetical protein Tsubulata_035031 [Turnera subulata]|uniref:Secreted protein n=1 Tax=Turnera subulata TaxID=218843 RepID=A0A9Q0F7Z2_9ROSI|nr:hypothetical protein Tsubulata_035031 [Turnera subulata]